MDIIKEIVENREKGAGRLLSEYGGRLKAAALSLCGNEASAQDLVMETIGIAVRQISSYRSEAEFFEWLYGIMQNLHRHSQRRKSAANEVLMDHPMDADDPDGVDRIVQEVDAEILRDAIRTLPDDMREAVIMRYFMDVPLAKMAKILCCPIGTVKSRLHYARVALARRLGATVRKSASMVALVAGLVLAAAAAVVATRAASGRAPAAASASESAPVHAAPVVGGPAGVSSAEGASDEEGEGAPQDGKDTAGEEEDAEIDEASTEGGTNMRRNLGRIYRRLTASAGMVLMTYMAAQGNPADPYIECYGTSGINTGYRMKGGASRVEVDFQLTTEASAQMRVFGNNVVSLEKSLGAMLYLTGEGGGPATGFRLQNIAATAQTNDVFWERTDYSGRYTAVVDFKNGVCDLAAGGLSDQKTFPAAAYAGLVADMPLSLFGMFSNAAATKFSNGTGLWDPRIAKAKVFGVKIYEDYDVAADDNSANLVHDFVPCRRDDGVACLKDLVTGRFATGEDVAAFTASDTAPEYPDDGYVSTVSETPGEYCYFDTNYQVKDTTRVELDCALASNMVGNANWVLFDAYYGGRFRLCFDQTFKYWVGSGAETAVDATGLPKPVAGRDVRRTFILDIPALSASVVTAGFTNGTAAVASAAPGYAASGNTLKLACVYGTTWAIASSGFAPLKIYGCRIYETTDGVENLIRDFVPYVKDGVSGIHDVKGGTMFANGWVKTTAASGTATSLPYGGAIMGENDAYIESAGTTGLSTGYRMKGAKSRVEVDFALTSDSGQQYVYGSGLGEGTLQTFFYTTGSSSGAGDSFKFCNRPYDGDACDTQYVAVPDTGRHTAVTDLKNKKNSIRPRPANASSSAEVKTFAYDFAGKTADLPLPIFGRYADNSGTTFNCAAKARIYSVRFYEDYDETEGAVNRPVHEYLPYSKGGEIGFMDTVTTNTIVCPAGSGFSFGGMGYDHGRFKPFMKPGFKKTASRTSGSTLGAFCPGVDAFRWYRDGEAVAGASAGDYTAVWTAGGKTNEYSAASVYTLYGVERESEPADPVVIVSSKLGMAITLK